MKLQPLFDKIVVKPETRVKSDIIEVIMHENDNMGTVIAAGKGKYDEKNRFVANPLKGGEKIRFGTMGASKADEYLKYFEYYEAGERYLVMSWQDVCYVREAEDGNQKAR